MGQALRTSVGVGRLKRLALTLFCAVSAAGLGACGTISEKMAGPMSSLPGIGMPADAPARPAETRPFPAVHDMPPPRASIVLDGSDQQKLEKELVAARNDQKALNAMPFEPEPEPEPAAAAAKPPAKPAKLATPKPAAPKPAPKPEAISTAPGTVPASSNRMIY